MAGITEGYKIDFKKKYYKFFQMNNCRQGEFQDKTTEEY